MIRLFRHYISSLTLLWILLDFSMFIAGFFAGCSLRLYAAHLDGTVEHLWLGILLAATLNSLIMIAVGIYQPQVWRDVRQYLARALLSLLASLILVATLSFFLSGLEFWRSNLLAGYVGATILLIFGRLLLRRVFKGNDFHLPVLVLGAGDRARKIKNYVDGGEGSILKLVSYVALSNDNDPMEDAVPLDDIGNLYNYAREQQIEEIVIAPDERRGGLPMADLVTCKMRGIRISDPVHLYERERGYVDLKAVQPSWLIYSDGFSGGKIYEKMLKRASDILISLLFILVSAPIMLLTALAVKVTSRGPVFYKQERVGQLGETFYLKKFRSMRVDAEADGTPQWAKKNDPRVTSIGQFIRLTRLDEMPQVFNVLLGDMSFVGPRPERPFFVEELAEEISFYNDRHCVKPGITGWAQLNYPYGASVEDARRKLEYDLYYIKNYSIFLDLLVVIQTVRVVLFPDGAR